MSTPTTSNIRNIAIVGHSGSGKTTLTELILHKTGVNSRFGRVDDKTSLSDHLEEEKETGHSITASAFHAPWKDVQINLIDTPGYPDFIGESIGALGGTDTAIIVISAVQGIGTNTRKMWEVAGELGMARAIVISKLDAEGVDFDGLVSKIQDTFGKRCIPLTYPVNPGPSLSGVVNTFLGTNVPEDLVDVAEELGTAIKERIVEIDDDLTERFLEDAISEEEFASNFTQALAQGAVVPILALSSEKEFGIRNLLDWLAGYAPCPANRGNWHLATDEEEGSLVIGKDESFVGQVFKIVRDPFAGKLSFVRIITGSLTSHDSVLTEGGHKAEKIGGLFHPQGNEQVATETALAGDIVGLKKIDSVKIGSPLVLKGDAPELRSIPFPRPMVSLALEPKSRADEQRISGALANLADSDATFIVERDPQTSELVARGITDMHLQVFLNRLKKKPYEVEVLTKVPKIPFQETILGKGQARYRHKKQTGGAGQFAEVELQIEPAERGDGLVYEWGVVGGVISQGYKGSIEKGIHSVMEKGVVAGYPMVDIKARVIDGKEHPVDSKDIAFQICAREVFQQAVGNAKPALLEPIVNLSVSIESSLMGDVTGDLNSRRGRVQNVDVLGELQTISALVPMMEVANYSTELRAMSGGAGTYTMDFSHYEPMPVHKMQEVIAARKSEEAEKVKK
ncbi:MAG: elongation factor G [Planctomycetota bacterium]|jgi:elongation factor G|nr:elongation factor G [Planctomycetota bacterium]